MVWHCVVTQGLQLLDEGEADAQVPQLDEQPDMKPIVATAATHTNSTDSLPMFMTLLLSHLICVLERGSFLPQEFVQTRKF